MDHLFEIAKRFHPEGEVVEVRAFGSGNINDTFLVTVTPAEKRFILQRMNTRVFLQPELVMRNMLIYTEHVRKRLHDTPPADGRRWEVPRVLPTQDNDTHWTDPDGSFWRAITFIENALSFDTIKDPSHAGEAGCALGLFHYLTSDLPPESLADTLKGFHLTPGYLQHYDKVLVKFRAGRSAEVEYCLRFITERRSGAYVLEDAKAQGKLPLRTIHGDPKINNVLIDTVTGHAVGMIDLDTVKPGLVHYDIGDCLRSCCNPPGEETEQLGSVYFDTDIAKTILKGYLSQAKTFLTKKDQEFIYDAVRLLAFELGLRFFTDYLEGNVYFKARHKEHNLSRALVQFSLTESIESQESAIRTIIKELL